MYNYVLHQAYFLFICGFIVFFSKLWLRISKMLAILIDNMFIVFGGGI